METLRYKVETRLDSGGQSEVYLARDRASGQVRVLKVLARPGDEQARARFEREFEVLVQLRHPGLVAAHDFGRLGDGRLYLALDSMAAGTLASCRLPVEPERADAWLAQLLEALAFLHAQDILHLDLKPANIFLGDSGGGRGAGIRLGDFGLIGRAGEQIPRAGTAGFVAPEVLRGETVDARADLYAVGAVAYELLVGRPCFAGADAEARMARQLDGDWDRAALRAVSPRLLPAVERLLAPSPALRFANVTELREAWPAWKLAAPQPSAADALPPSHESALAGLLEALLGEPPRGARVAGPPGSARSALLRAAYGRMRVLGLDARLLSASAAARPAVWQGLGGADLILDDVHLLDGTAFRELVAQFSERPPRSIALGYDSALLQPTTRVAIRELIPRARHVRLEAADGAAGAAGDSLDRLLEALPADTLRFLWVAAWLGEPEAAARAAEFSPALEPPLSLAGPRAWLKETARLLSALDRVLPAPGREELARGALRFAGALRPADRARLAVLAGDRARGLAALVEEARGAGTAAAWRAVLEVLPEDESHWALLDEALAFFERAGGDRAEEGALRRRLAGPAGARARGELKRRLGWCRLRAGDRDTAQDLLGEALTAAGSDPGPRALALADLGWLHFSGGGVDEARRCYREALRGLGSSLPAVRSRVHNRMGVLLWRQGDLAEAEKVLRTGLRDARKAGDANVEFACWGNLTLVLTDRGDAAGTVRLCSEALETEKRTRVRMYLHQHVASSARYLFRYGEALAHARLSLAAAEEGGDPDELPTHLCTLAMFEALCGHSEEALSLLEELRPPRSRAETSMTLGTRGQVLWSIGKLEQAERCLRAAFRLRLREGAASYAAAALADRLGVARETGNRESLRLLLAEAAEISRMGLTARGACTLELATLAARLTLNPRDPAAPAELEALDARLRELGLLELRFHLLLLVADSQLETGKLEAAEATLAVARAVCGPSDSPGAILRVQELAARMKAERGLLRDALADLAAVASRYDRMGADYPRRRVLDLHFRLSQRAGAAEDALSTDVLLELAEIVYSIDSLHQVLEKSMDLLLTRLPAERCVVLLADAPNGALRVAAWRGDGEDVGDEAMLLSTTVVRRAARSEGAIHSGNLASDPDFRRSASAERLHICSVLCQALLSDGGVIGAVYLDHRGRMDAFNDSHRQLLGGFTRLIAVAIKQSRAREDLARAQQVLTRENFDLRRNAVAPPEPFICESLQMKELLRQVERVAPFRATVLLTGQSGTGKERLANMLHNMSPRAERPFVKFNCAAVPATLMESELFGIEAGTASDVGSRVGIFEYATGGTLLLDEIGDMEPALQAKLLRVLQDGEVRRVGGREPVHVDVRLVAATNRDLEALTREGKFREDLLFRINSVTLRVPPLRERPDDILPLAEHFLDYFAESMRVPRPTFSHAFVAYLRNNPWRGNVRELRNVVERALIMQRGPSLGPPVRALEISLGEGPRPLAQHVGLAEQEVLLEALRENRWNKTRTARRLGVSEGAVRYKMKKYGLVRPRTEAPRKGSS